MSNSQDSSPRRLVAGYMDGLRATFAGFAFLCRYPKLWAYGIVPCLVNVVVAIVVLVGVYCLADWGISNLTPELPDAWYGKLVRIGIIVAVILIAIAAAVIAYLLMQSVFCSYFFSLLARRVDLFLGATPAELTEVSIGASISDALRASLKLIVINAALMVLNLVPGLGSLVAVALGFYIDAFILGAEFMGYPLEQRGVRWLQRQEFAKTWRGMTLGLGSVVLVLMLIPVVGAVLHATAVVGAVLLYRDVNGLSIEPPDENVV